MSIYSTRVHELCSERDFFLSSNLFLQFIKIIIDGESIRASHSVSPKLNGCKRSDLIIYSSPY